MSALPAQTRPVTTQHSTTRPPWPGNLGSIVSKFEKQQACSGSISPCCFSPDRVLAPPKRTTKRTLQLHFHSIQYPSTSPPSPSPPPWTPFLDLQDWILRDTHPVLPTTESRLPTPPGCLPAKAIVRDLDESSSSVEHTSGERVHATSYGKQQGMNTVENKTIHSLFGRNLLARIPLSLDGER